jgi:hypothetical protein
MRTIDVRTNEERLKLPFERIDETQDGQLILVYCGASEFTFFVPISLTGSDVNNYVQKRVQAMINRNGGELPC